jgi:hypothetical protein
MKMYNLDDFDDDFEIVGPSKESNPYLKSMIKFYKQRKGNLFAFLKTCSDDDLKGLSDCLETKNDKWKTVATHLSVMAYSIEKGRSGKSFNVEIETLMKNVEAFCGMCAMVLMEKLDIAKVDDGSYFWDPQANLTILLNKDFDEIFKHMKK